MTRAVVTLLLLIGIGYLGTPAPIIAQDTSNPLTARAESLAVELERITVQYREKESRIETLTGEDSIVVRREMVELVFGAFDETEQLIDVLLKMEADGLASREPRALATSLLAKVPEGLRRRANEMSAELKELRTESEKAPPDELAMIEENIATAEEGLDRLYSLGVRYIEMSERLGLDSGAFREELGGTLLQRTALIAGLIRLDLEKRDRFEQQAKQYPGDTSYKKQADAAQMAVDKGVETLERKIRMMDDLGIDVTEYRTLVVEVTGEIARGLTDAKVAVNLVQAWIGQARDWVTGNGPAVMVKILLFLLILFVFRVLGRVISKAVTRAIERSKFQPSKLLANMIAGATGNIVFLFGLLVALSQVGVTLGPLLAGLGVVGFIIGFALQETLSNFAAGMMILFYRPFDVGDVVEVAGVTGKVSNMSLVSTTILTFDNQALIVPNGKIWGDVIRNVTAQTSRRVDMVFGISYTDDIPKAEAVLKSIIDSHDKVLGDPEPTIRLHELADSSVNFVVRPWVKTEDYWDVYWDITREVKMRFDSEEISIPFPQRDVHLHQSPAA